MSAAATSDRMHSQREGALKTQRIKSSFSRDAKNRLRAQAQPRLGRPQVAALKSTLATLDLKERRLLTRCLQRLVRWSDCITCGSLSEHLPDMVAASGRAETRN